MRTRTWKPALAAVAIAAARICCEAGILAGEPCPHAAAGAALEGGRIGIDGRYLGREEAADLLNLDVEGGVLVERVAEGSPAEAAGLRGGSLTARLQGEDILLGGDFILQLETHWVCAGACLESAPTEMGRFSWIGVTFLRGGQVLTAAIRIEPPLEAPRAAN